MVALNYTLDRLYMTVDVKTIIGANRFKIRPSRTILNLKDQIQLNSHDLYELKFDKNDLLVKGSGEFLEKMEELITEYTLSIDVMQKYRDMYNQAFLDRTFRRNYPGDAKLLNNLY